MIGKGMEREEFINAYMARSNVSDFRIEGERVFIGRRERLALPCLCGEDGCEGWAMIPPELRLWHLFQSGPDEGRPTWDAVQDEALRA